MLLVYGCGGRVTTVFGTLPAEEAAGAGLALRAGVGGAGRRGQGRLPGGATPFDIT